MTCSINSLSKQTSKDVNLSGIAHVFMCLCLTICIYVSLFDISFNWIMCTKHDQQVSSRVVHLTVCASRIPTSAYSVLSIRMNFYNAQVFWKCHSLRQGLLLINNHWLKFRTIHCRVKDYGEMHLFIASTLNLNGLSTTAFAVQLPGRSNITGKHEFTIIVPIYFVL